MKTEISKTLSLCNISVFSNKKGDRYDSHHPKLTRIDPYVFQAQGSRRKINFSNFFLITKTVQMYVFF